MVDAPHESASEAPRSQLSSCLLGCLIAFAVFLVIVGSLAFWISRNWRGWASDLAMQAIEQSIEAWDLPEQERLEVKEQVERVGTAFREGRLSIEQVGQIAEGMAPLAPMFVVAAVEATYLDESGLTEEEQAEGAISLQRFVQGLMAGTIEDEAIGTVMQHISDRQPDGSWRLRKNVSDDELRGALAAAKDQADGAGIPAEPDAIDPSDQLRQIIDQVMQTP